MDEHACPRCGEKELIDLEGPEDFSQAIPYPFKQEIEAIWNGLRNRLKLELCASCGYIGAVARNEEVIEELKENFK